MTGSMYEPAVQPKFLLVLKVLTWTPPVCQVSIGEEDRLPSYIRPVDGVLSPGLYGIRRRGPI